MTYMVYYTTLGIGQTYCGKHLSRERADKMFDDIVQCWGGETDLTKVGMHPSNSSLDVRRWESNS